MSGSNKKGAGPIIRLAENSDKQALVEIWTACFPDDAAYAAFFLRWCFGRDVCLLEERAGRPVAMLHLLPQTLRLASGGEHPVLYVYAAATLPDYRGGGIMAGLLARAREEAKRLGRAYLTLLPGSRGLYDYYAAQGYREAFCVRQASLSRARLEELTQGVPAAELNGMSPRLGEIPGLRRSLAGDALLWDAGMERYPVREWLYTGGDIFVGAGGYAFCRKNGDVLDIREFLFPEESSAPAARFLAQWYGCGSYTFTFSPASGFFTQAQTLSRGMIRPADDNNTHTALSSAPGGIYMNLVLE